MRSAVCCHLLREFVCLWRMGIARIELLYFLTLYLVSIPLQLVTTSSFLHQGSTALIAVTAVHAGIVAALFWCLLGECIVLFTSFRPFVMFPPLSQPLRASCFIFFFSILLSLFRSWRSTPEHHNHGISLDFYHYCYGITHLHDSFFLLPLWINSRMDQLPSPPYGFAWNRPGRTRRGMQVIRNGTMETQRYRGRM